MQFIVTGRDGTDPKALERRMAVREAHLKQADGLKAEGKLLYAAALLDDAGKMAGSVMICEFASRADLDGWLAVEPYVTGKVWAAVEVRPCKVGPAFVKNPA
ncbi:MAG TPA: YciI family protein [Elusimicrobiota bacterium]|jgi:uncharacterized protein YciI|nr:YciI family protein [Elusimicrobiota bacterium]